VGQMTLHDNGKNYSIHCTASLSPDNLEIELVLLQYSKAGRMKIVRHGTVDLRACLSTRRLCAIILWNAT
jgi:hypothetical protein